MTKPDPESIWAHLLVKDGKPVVESRSVNTFCICTVLFSIAVFIYVSHHLFFNRLPRFGYFSFLFVVGNIFGVSVGFASTALGNLFVRVFRKVRGDVDK
jgi:hypothetical protein